MYKQIELRGSRSVTRHFLSAFLALALIACLLVGESMAGGKGKGGGGDDIILYNGNIVLRGNGGGGKGKGKGGGGGSIVVANSPQNHHHQEHDYMPMFDSWGGDFGRR